MSKSEKDFDAMTAEYEVHDYTDEKRESKAGAGNADKAKKTQEKLRRRFVGGLQRVVLARRFLGYSDCMNPGDAAVPTKFVCVDIESYERQHSAILEIGIVVLEPWDIPMGKSGPTSAHDMYKKAKIHHFLIQDYKHLRNGDFVVDNKDKFQFGKSEWISLKDAPRRVAECFRFNGPNGMKGRTAFIGHDTKSDDQFLKTMGYNVDNIAGLEKFDTAKMYQATKKEANPRSLGTMCNDLGIETWFLHNAGVYVSSIIVQMC